MAVGGGLHSEPLPHAVGTHLHRVRLASPRLAIGEDADVEAIDAGGDQGLHLLEHLRWGTCDGGRGAARTKGPYQQLPHDPRPLCFSNPTAHAIVGNQLTLEESMTTRSLTPASVGGLTAE